MNNYSFQGYLGTYFYKKLRTLQMYIEKPFGTRGGIIYATTNTKKNRPGSRRVFKNVAQIFIYKIN
jgi:hypothetical protein